MSSACFLDYVINLLDINYYIIGCQKLRRYYLDRFDIKRTISIKDNILNHPQKDKIG